MGKWHDMDQDHLVRLCSLFSLPQKSVAVSILPSRKSPWPVVPPYLFPALSRLCAGWRAGWMKLAMVGLLGRTGSPPADPR